MTWLKSISSAKRTYALRFLGATDELKGFKASFDDMPSLEKVIRTRSDVAEGSKLYWQLAKADELPMEWDNDATLPALPWVVVESSQKGGLLCQSRHGIKRSNSL